MKIHVTAEDIAAGVREDCSQCPVARAIIRETQCNSVNVDGGYFISVDGRLYEGELSTENFISDFDDGRPVEPFEFELTEKEYDSEDF